MLTYLSRLLVRLGLLARENRDENVNLMDYKSILQADSIVNGWVSN